MACVVLKAPRIALADTDAQPHDCVAVNASHSLDRPDAVPFGQGRYRRNLLVFRQDVCHCLAIH